VIDLLLVSKIAFPKRVDLRRYASAGEYYDKCLDMDG
jgi:hypothetical protein